MRPLLAFVLACVAVIANTQAPVGRWHCLPDIAYENIGKSNRVAHVEPCWILGRAWLEFRAGGEGWTMGAYGADNRHRPAKTFTIPGSANVYARAHEFRWAYDDQGDTGELHIQATQNDYWTILEVSPDVLQLTRPKQGIFLLFRIGSRSTCGWASSSGASRATSTRPCSNSTTAATRRRLVAARRRAGRRDGEGRAFTSQTVLWCSGT